MRNSVRFISDVHNWNLNDFELEARPIGVGAFGEVYRAKCIRPGYGDKLVAIKTISKEKIQQNKRLRKYVEQEILIHKQLKHPNIVEFYTNFEDDNFVYLVLELCKQTLDEFLKTEAPIAEIIAINIIEQVVKGMLYLHKRKIVHRDISLRNILLTSDTKVKICDLGFAAPEKENFRSVIGTPQFQSHEIKNGEPYNYKSDSYSLGCVIYAVLGGKLPLDKKLINTDNFSPKAIKLMEDLLEEDARKRVGVEKVLQYEFFDEYGGHFSKAKNDSYRSKDSGMGSLNYSSSSGKNRLWSSKYINSGLDSFNWGLKELNKNHFPNALKKDSKTSGRTHDKHISQNFKESLEQRCLPIQAFHPQNNILERASPSFRSAHSNRRERSVSEERQRQERAHSSERHCYPNYKLHASAPIRSTYSDTREHSVSEERKRQEAYDSLYTTRSRNNETNSQQCLPHEETDSFSYSHYSKINTPTEKCKIENCKFKNSSLEDNYSNHQSLLSLISEKKISQQNSQNDQKSVALISNHSSCNNQSRINLSSKKSQHGPSNEIQKPQRLNAERLAPCRLSLKKKNVQFAIVSILENEDVYIEWLKTKKKKQFISKVLQIVGKKDKIYAYEPEPKDSLVRDKPPPWPGNIEDIEDFSFDKLPPRYYKMYRNAKKIIDSVRATTIKITYFADNFKFVMMENYPDPDLVMEFLNGETIKQISNKILILDNSGNIVEYMNDHFQAMYAKFTDMKAWGEKAVEMLETSTISFPYPIMLGKFDPIFELVQETLQAVAVFQS